MPSKYVPKVCKNCGGPKHFGGGRQLCDECSAHCGEHVRFTTACKACQTRQSVRSTRMKEYGLTLAEVIVLEQIGECQVCGSTYKLCVDHCHDTGRVRGILCWHCNVALGNVRDNPDTLRKLADYLEV